MKIRTIIQIAVIILYPFASIGQAKYERHYLLKSEIIDSLQKHNVTESLTIIRLCGCGPKIILDENENEIFSGTDFEGYILWNDKDENYIQKFDLYGKHPPAKLINSDVLDFAKRNINKIKSEEILLFGPKHVREYIVEPVAVRFDIFINAESHRVEKSLTEIQLNKFLEEHNNHSPKNRNFVHNQKLKSVKLFYKLKKIISEQNNLQK